MVRQYDGAHTGGNGVAVIGSGSIGVSWAIVFARAGRAVTLHDVDKYRLEHAQVELGAQLAALEVVGLLEQPADVVGARIKFSARLEAAVATAGHIQECISEDVVDKQTLFAELEDLARADAVFASSSSAITASVLFEHVRSRERCLVAHPANPPHLLPIVEIVPSEHTSVSFVERTSSLMKLVGMAPVVLRREVEGFVYNRLQGAVLREAYCLVRDGVADVEEIDRVMTEGLGRRWAVVGPFETADLNVRGGIAQHALRMGPAYHRMGRERGQDDPWTPDLVARVAEQRRALLPLAEWQDRVAWRDRMLAVYERARRVERGPNSAQ